jgi:UDP-glucose 4-epimerase
LRRGPELDYSERALMTLKQDRRNPSRYLITGGSGFIGSHAAEALLASGHNVTAIDDLSTGRIENIAHLRGHENFEFVRATILDSMVMDRLASKADIIIHLAAAVGVQLIVEHPVHTIETNVKGTEQVLDAALRYGCRVLVASTSEVYGKGSRIPFREDDDVLLGPTSKSRWAYAASKMVDEFLGLAYQREYGLDVVVIRLFNTVGARQTGQYGMVVPRFVQQALAGEPITVYGDGTQRRCFCSVLDVVRALTGLAEHRDAKGTVFNVGADEEVSIEELARRIKALVGTDSEIVFMPYSEAYAPGFEDMKRRVPDTSRIQGLIGWQPERSLDEILESVVEYEQSERRRAPEPEDMAGSDAPTLS